MEGLLVGEKSAPIVAIGMPTKHSLEEIKNMTNNDEAFSMALPLPGLLSLLGKRDINGFVPGIKDLVYGNEEYGIWSFEKLKAVGQEAISDMADYHKAKAVGDTAAMKAAEEHFHGIVANVNGVKVERAELMGYGYLTDPAKQFYAPIAPTFYSFHLMVGLGFWFILLFVLAYMSITKGSFLENRLVQKLAVYTIPLPWIAISFGWMSAEIGRQPWTVFGILPTANSATPLDLVNVQATFFMFLLAFVVLGIAELKMLFTVVKSGPKGAH